MSAPNVDCLLHENQELRRRLAAAEETAGRLQKREAETTTGPGLADRHFRAMINALHIAIYTTDVEGRITHFNPAAVELFGRVPVIGSDLWCVAWKLFRTDGTPLPHDECPMAVSLREQRPLQGPEAIVERPDGTRRRFEAYPTPLFDDMGELIGGVNILIDITDRQQVDEVRSRLAAIVDSSDDAIVSKDLNGIISSWNTSAERLFGYTAAETIGKPVTMLIPEDRQDEEPRILSRLKSGERVDHFDTVRIRKDGTRIPVSLTVSPIRDSHGRIVGASKIARDITERKRYEEAIRDADRRKDEFLATLAHELRNPLAPIRNAVQLLQARGPQVPELIWARAVVDRQVQLMSRLLEDLLDVSRISRNKLELRKEQIELARVVEMAVETSRPLIEKGGHRLVVELPREPIRLDADPVRLAQVFANLLNNAAKYTEHAGSIHLSAKLHENEVVISVQDNGIGIAPDMIPYLFEIFSQAKPALNRSQGGLGVGLSLVKGLVELHGGRVEAHSAGPGQGSMFTVHLPLDQGAAKPAPAASYSVGADQPAARHRILIVDDNRDGADSLAMLLQALGHEVATAYDGHQAIQAAQKLIPDVVLLDIGMPNLNGYDTCRHIRQQPWGRDLFLIALTGWGQDEDRRRTREAGFDHHMVKPLDSTEFLELLERLAPPSNAAKFS